jgi:hypothetical protein
VSGIWPEPTLGLCDAASTAAAGYRRSGVVSNRRRCCFSA